MHNCCEQLPPRFPASSIFLSFSSQLQEKNPLEQLLLALALESFTAPILPPVIIGSFRDGQESTVLPSWTSAATCKASSYPPWDKENTTMPILCQCLPTYQRKSPVLPPCSFLAEKTNSNSSLPHAFIGTPCSSPNLNDGPASSFHVAKTISKHKQT